MNSDTEHVVTAAGPRGPAVPEPASVPPTPFVRIAIPLTFGNRWDWSQNVRAVGRCSIRLNGRDYVATRLCLHAERDNSL